MKILISCPWGLGSLLANELKRLHLKPFGSFSRGTRVETDLRGLYQINLRSRLANKVYVQLAAGEARNFDQLFELVKKSDYGQRTANSNLSLKVSTHKSQLSAQRAIQSVAHKALLEGISNFAKAEEWTAELLLMIENNQATLLLNTSGASLHQRGYRTQTGQAPLKENLAAALVLLSGWKFKSPLIDPFCGSGTIAMEALLLAKNIAPWSRRSFAFERLRRYDYHLWQELKQQAQAKVFDGEYLIYGYDQDAQMIAFAKQNAQNRGLERQIHFEQRTFAAQGGKSAFQPFDEKYRILTNPPYGKRLNAPDIQELYQALYASFGAECYGGVISSFPAEGLSPQLWSQKKLFNGDEECIFSYKKLS